MSPTSPDAAQDDLDEAGKLRRAEALEASGNVSGAFDLYREILADTDDPSDVTARMGRLAIRSGHLEMAEEMLLVHAAGSSPRSELVADLARLQAQQGAFDRAQKTLERAIQSKPGEAELWFTLGQVLCLQGRHAEALVFLEEALKFDPGLVAAKDQLADAILLQGDVERALSLSAEARDGASKDDLPAITAAHARRLLGVGRLAEGWAAFVAGTAGGSAAQATFRVAAPRWTPGRRELGQVVLFGEDQLADEVLLVSALRSIQATDAKFILAVDERLMPLAARSFPDANVAKRLSRDFAGRRQHAAALDTVQIHGGELVSAWIPLRELAAAGRQDPSAFPKAVASFQPDPVRVAHWRGWLDSLGAEPKVGLQCRPDAGRPVWEAPAPAALGGAVSTAGVHVVALGAAVDDALGLPVRHPPGLDSDNLNDLAALTLALDAVVAPAGVAAYLAGGAGARTFILAPPRHWAMLGSGSYPWFVNARAFCAMTPSDWSSALAELSGALAELAGDPHSSGTNPKP